jgi:hypothetical protein
MALNPYAIQPLLFVAKGIDYDSRYRTGLDSVFRVLQDWCLQQVRATFRLLRTKNIYIPRTVEELNTDPAGTFGAFHQYLSQIPVNDSTKQRIEFCNWRRVYVVNAIGPFEHIGNMVGRPTWGCPSDADNPLDPWGPGTAAGFTGISLELVRGNFGAITEQDRIDHAGLRYENKNRGAVLHELLHCVGVQHPGQVGTYAEVMTERYGVKGWSSIMAGWWYFGERGRLFPEEAEYLRGSPFFA